LSTFEEASRRAPTAGGGDGTFFARQATGLVREGKTYDAFIYNVMWSGGALTLAFMYLLVPTLYPGANLWITVLIAALLGLGGAFLYALLTTLMPRTGGDYVFVSRTIHPALGFAANFSYVFWNMVVVGVYATFMSTYGAGALLRMFVGFGASDSLLSTADWFATDWGVFITGVVMTLLAALTFILGGTHFFFRLQQLTFIWYILGAFLLVVLVGLFTSHASFLGSFNDYAANLGTAHGAANVAAGAKKAGYEGTGYTAHDTIKAVSVAWFIFGFIYSSNYFAGEIKTGRRVQFYAIPGAVAAVVLLLLITIPSFQHMVGRDFINQLGTADPAAYGFAAGAPAYPEIAAIGSGSPILGFIIIVGFVGGIVAWLPMTMMLASRCFLAWSFDKVMPEKLSEVDERTHSPIIAVLIVALLYILSTAAYAFTDWFTTLTVLFPETLTLLVVAIAGAVLPFRRRQLYESSARAKNVFGLPLLTVVGIVAFIGFAIAEFILLTDPGSGTSISDNPRIVLISLGIFFIAAPLIYFGSRALRKSQGIDLDLAYAEIPPE
jgi:basic amino acid/polyamine antiporter, APA family